LTSAAYPGTFSNPYGVERRVCAAENRRRSLCRSIGCLLALPYELIE
jgi:hypothetical protein